MLQLIKQAPKPVLHLHLDGSLPVNFIEKIAHVRGIKLPCEASQLRRWSLQMKSLITHRGPVPLNSNWPVFTYFNQFLQHSEDIREGVRALCTEMYFQHGVNCLEIRFAPILSTNKISEREAIQAACDGFKQCAQQFSIKGGIILCAIRSYPPEKAIETVRLAHEFRQSEQYVIGFDLAGDEATYPLHLHREAFALAQQLAVPATCHAGEWNENYKTFENIELALELGCRRIGHGLTLRQALKDESKAAILEQIRQKNIGVEICLTSNCSNPNKCEWYDKHPLRDFLKAGVRIAALNPDNCLISGNEKTGDATPEGEIIHALQDCKCTPLEIVQIIGDGYRSSFDNTITEEWITQQTDYWNKIVFRDYPE